jgi:hypothetical protein
MAHCARTYIIKDDRKERTCDVDTVLAENGRGRGIREVYEVILYVGKHDVNELNGVMLQASRHRDAIINIKDTGRVGNESRMMMMNRT